MRYMIVEHFRYGDPVPVYARFRERGRLTPEGLLYIDSWVTADLLGAYQIMECEDPRLLDEWIRQWEDLVAFEIHPIIGSAEAALRVP